jgi:hemoglobin
MFDRVGGMPFFELLSERFYAGVVDDPVLAPMYPDDLDGARQRLALFLAQYWGGPGWYSEQRGHPRLRMRHARFAIDDQARQAWMRHMEAAVRAGGLSPDDEATMLDYFSAAADHLRNTA